MPLSGTEPSLTFTRAPEDLQLPISGHVHLWSIPLTVARPLPDSLSQEECSRMSHFRFEKDRNRFLHTHVATRSILAQYLQTEPGELTFETGPWGKPSLSHPGNSLEFNLSHSHEWSLLAISSNQTVGVDLEYRKDTVDCDELASSILTKEELPRFEQLNATDRFHHFFHAWSAKEAFLKCLGTGLSIDPREVEMIATGDQEQIQSIGTQPSAPHHLQPLSFHPDYSSFLCTPSPVNTLHCHRFSSDN